MIEFGIVIGSRSIPARQLASGPPSGPRQDGRREVLAGANGRRGREMRVRRDPGRLDPIAPAQVGDERLRGGDLPGRGRLLIEIADEADADAVLVDVVAAGVAAMDALLLADSSAGRPRSGRRRCRCRCR